MAAWTDPKFIGGILGVLLGGVRALGNEIGGTVGEVPLTGRPGAAAEAARLAAEGRAISSSDVAAQQMRDPGAIVTAAFGQDDPRAIAARVRPAYIGMIQRSLAALNASGGESMSGGDAAAVSGSGSNLAADLAPLTVFDRLNALDEQFGPSVEAYRRTFSVPERPGVFIGLGPDYGVRSASMVGGQFAPLDYYPARLAAIRATVEAVVFGRNVLTPYGVSILNDQTGELTPEWITYISTYSILGPDLETMARELTIQQPPRPGPFQNFLATVGTAISFVMGGINLVQGVINFSNNLSTGAPIDTRLAAGEAGNLLNQALTLYGAGVRVSGVNQQTQERVAIAAPLAPEEGRILQWMAQNPQKYEARLMPAHDVTVYSKTSPAAAPREDVVPGTILRALGGGGVLIAQAVRALGGASALDQTVRASGVLSAETMAATQNIPGALSLKCTLLARRWPAVVAGRFAQVYIPRVGQLSGIA